MLVFFTEYLSKNERRNKIIGELWINVSVHFIGRSQIWGRGLPYIVNIWARVEATGFVSSSNISNHTWGGSFTYPTSMINLPWGGSVDAGPD